jgi:FOG: Ankyrin repeat
MGWTILHSMASKSTRPRPEPPSAIHLDLETDVVSFLIKDDIGIEIDTKDNSGRTALWLAGAHHNFSVLKKLLERGADEKSINNRDKKGRSVLHACILAMRYEDIECVNLFLELGVEVDATDNLG